LLFPVPSLGKFVEEQNDGIPGEIIFGTGTIILNMRRKAVILKVVNKADRPIQVNCLLLICVYSSVHAVLYSVISLEIDLYVNYVFVAAIGYQLPHIEPFPSF